MAGAVLSFGPTTLSATGYLVLPVFGGGLTAALWIFALGPFAVAVAAPPKQRSATSTISKIVAFLFGILQALLVLRIVLLLLVANQDNAIVSWVLSVTDPFVEPFRGVFNLDEIEGQRGAVLDVAAVVAIIAWSLIETLILSVLRLIGRRD